MSKLHRRNIDDERMVILREMQEVEKSTEEVIFDRLHLTAFRDDPLGFTILGPVENIQTINQEQLKTYINNNYTWDRMVIVCVGDVDHNHLQQCAEDMFGQFPATNFN